MSLVCKDISPNLIKTIKNLRDLKYRESVGFFVSEGKRLVAEAEKYGQVLEVVVSKSFFCKYEQYLVELFNRRVINLASERIFSKISLTENSQGILALTKIKKTYPSFPEGDFLLFLENINDPGNFGTIVRTAEAAGVNAIISNNSCSFTNEKVIRATMGSIFRIPIYEEIDIIEFKKRGYKLFASALENANEIQKIDTNLLLGKILIAIGSESFGLNRETIENCETRIKIPMSGNIESLNVASATAIICYFLKFKRNNMCL